MDELNELSACFTLGHLMDAANKCAKRVAWKHQVQRFMNDRLCQCEKLREEVLSGTWTPTETKPFIIHERGKVRRVSPINMRDRVVERCLCDNVLVPFIRETASEDSSACLQGRGTLYARDRIRQYLEDAPLDAWVFQYDFHDYFHTINRERLIEMISPYLSSAIVNVVGLSIGNNGFGLELGSHVSQLLAMWYPTDLDKLMEKRPGIIGYHRYMDDGIAIFEDKQSALDGMAFFVSEAEARGYQMNQNKTHCNRATHPIIFCKEKYTKRPDGVRVTIRKQQTHRNIRHIRRVIRRSQYFDIDLIPLYASCAGYLDRADNKMSHLLDERIIWPL